MKRIGYRSVVGVSMWVVCVGAEIEVEGEITRIISGHSNVKKGTVFSDDRALELLPIVQKTHPSARLVDIHPLNP